MTHLRSGKIRRLVQILFLIIVCYIGVQFFCFVLPLEQGLLPDVQRPPGVEAFLPISSLVSLKYLLFTGIINRVHPAGLVLFIVICLTAFVVKKGFCSWVCPVGTLSEFLYLLRQKMWKTRIRLPAWADNPLRGVKYILAGFFIWSVFIKMPLAAIDHFLASPYNRFADIQMLYFFKEISAPALAVLIGLLVLSCLIRDFWCRYACPYGALLGILSFLSLIQIKRNDKACNSCGICEKNCPGRIQIRRKTKVRSPECSMCLSCVDRCPQKGAIGLVLISKQIRPAGVTIGVILLFMFASAVYTARNNGFWENQIPKGQYLRYVVRTRLPWHRMDTLSPEQREKLMQVMRNLQMSNPE